MSTDQNPEEPKPVTGAEQGDTKASTPEPTQPLSPAEADKASSAKANEALISDLFKISEAEKKEPAPSEPAKEEPKAEAPKSDPSPESKAEVKLELPVVPHPYDEVDDPDPDQFVDPKFSKIHENVDKLRTKLRKAREDGSFGRTLVDTASKNGIDPQRLAELVTRNIRFAQGDPTAIAEVAAELQRRGVKFAEEKRVDPVEEAANRIYEENFAADVKGNIADEDYARRKARAIAERVAPKSEPVAPRIPQQQAPDISAQLEQRASIEVGQLAERYDQAYKKAGMDFNPIAAEANKRIQDQIKTQGKIPPHLWNFTYAQKVREVQAEIANKPKPVETPQVKVPVNNPLRASTAPTTLNPNSLTEVKSALVRELMSS